MIEEKRLLPKIGAAVVIVIAVMTLLASFKIVQPSYKGLVVKAGQLQDTVVNDGLHFRTPMYTEIIPIFVGNLTTDKYKKSNGLFGKDDEFVEESPFRGIQPLSKDGQMLDIDVQINYQITDPVKFRRETGSTDPETIEGLLFVPTVRRLVYDYAAEYGWKELIQEGERQEFNNRILIGMSDGITNKRECSKEVTEVDEATGTEIVKAAGCELVDGPSISKPLDYGVTITAVNFKKIRPNQAIIEAVEKAQAKEQEVKIAAQEAAIARENANKEIEQKRGQTESQKLEADARAYALRVEKEQEAEGVKALAEAEKARAQALAASQQLVEYKRLDIEMKKAEALLEFGKHWSGAVPHELNVIGTEEAAGMSLFMGMSPVVTTN